MACRSPAKKRARAWSTGFAEVLQGAPGTVDVCEASVCLDHKFSKLDLPDGVDISKIPVTYETSAPDLITVKGLAAFMEKMRGVAERMREQFGVPLRLVVIDTFSQSFGSQIEDENSASSVAKATTAMQKIADALSLAVIAVHHYGKDERAGMRGSSALRGNADFILAVRAAGELVLDKARDSAEGVLGWFDMPTVEMGRKPNGNPFTSRFIAARGDQWPDLADLGQPSKPTEFGSGFRREFRRSARSQRRGATYLRGWGAAPDGSYRRRAASVLSTMGEIARSEPEGISPNARRACR